MTPSNAGQVCLVEDDEIMGESLVDRFELEGFRCDWHRSAQTAASDLKEKRYDVVVSDIRLPDRDGDELFEQLQGEQLYVPPWIFITGYGTIERAIALMKLGAADYVTKPFDLDQLVQASGAHSESPHDERLPTLGLSAGMQRIEDMLPRLAASGDDSPHHWAVGRREGGRRARDSSPGQPAGDQAVRPVNCGGIPESLLEAELFGHERGAFTGAMRLKHGLLEQANGGTLFLDEIGDMPLAMQVKLLRVLQERTVSRLGSEQSVAVDFRLICATHRDLKKLVELGRVSRGPVLSGKRGPSTGAAAARASGGYSVVRASVPARVAQQNVGPAKGLSPGR